MPQQQIDIAFTETIAEKITGLVDNRDFLGWEKAASAAQVIVKLIGKSTDDVEEQKPLYDAGLLLSSRYGGDQARKALVIRDALAVLREKRDAVVITRATELHGASSSRMLQPGSVQRGAAVRSRVSSPFLVPSTIS